MTKGKKWLILAAVFFAVCLAAGSFAAVKTAPQTLYSYFENLATGEISIRTGTAVCDALILWAVLFFSAFFRFGGVTCAAALGVKGFTDGYAVAAILRILGIRGMAMCFFDILGAPLAVVMAALAMCQLFLPQAEGRHYLAAGGVLLALMSLSALVGAALARVMIGTALGGIQ